MNLRFPSGDQRPIILMVVQSGGHFHFMPMLLDTGSDATCFPASTAEAFGHDNRATEVIRKIKTGIGGGAMSYVHSDLKFSLLDPYSKSLSPDVEFPETIWTSSITEFHFIEGFNANYGLLGRDVMREWKSFKMIPRGDEWIMEIEL